MKLDRLSLAAMMVVGALTSVNAADTLADAFKNGTVKGTLEAWYWDRDMQVNGKHEDLLNLGLKLSYTTDTFYGLFGGVTLQTSNSPFASTIAKTIVFKANEYGPGAILSEGYIGYKMDKTVAKIGRQYIATPLIASSPNRIIKQSFEGMTVVNTNLPQTMIFGGYVNKYQNRTDLNGGMAEFTNNFWIGSPLPGSQSAIAGNTKAWKTLDGEAYSLMAVNQSIPGVKLTGQWVGITDLANLYYAEVAYSGKASHFTYGLAGQYQMTDFDSSMNSNDSGYYGLKASLGIDAFKTYVAYSKIDEDTTAIPGVGGGPYGTIYTSQIWLTPGTFNAGTKAYAIDANYNFKSLNVKAGVRYSNVDIPVGNGTATATEIDYTTLYVNYQFMGALKGLSLDIGYEKADWNTATDTKELRFNVNYNF
ncbi:MAG: OprD family outer membrane porin [Sulfurospirillaceae bacterium]|nr:OprD family outer membrane porin [Sulfurospirillaceae bacterium]MDD2825716.1 OprD family outer membrane porin [Sulfurospirillaceae bacterium]